MNGLEIVCRAGRRLSWSLGVLVVGGLSAQAELGRVEGVHANARMGCSMAGSGGRWYVGASGHNPYGVATGSVGTWTWSAAAGLVLLRTNVGSTAGAGFGTCVAAGPNGGVVVGEPAGNVPTVGAAGRVVVLSSTGATVGTVLGSASGGAFGSSVTAIGDLDGDGTTDCLAAQPYWGWVSCFWSSDWTSRLMVAPAAGLGAVVQARIDGTWGCPGSSAAVDYMGYRPQSVAGLGSAPGGSPQFAFGVTNRNRVDVYGWQTTPNPGLVLIRSISGPSGFGKAICSVGDLNGDTIPDFAVGAPDARIVQIHDGSNGAVIRSWTASAQSFGAALALLNDQDGDGTPELLIGAPNGGSNPGEAYVFSLRLDPTTQAPVERLLAVLRGRVAGGGFGDAVCAVPDQNGDGRDEIGIGAPSATVGGNAGAGQAFLFSLARSTARSAHVGTGCLPPTVGGPQPRISSATGNLEAGAPFSITATHCAVGGLAVFVMDVNPLSPPIPMPYPGMNGCTHYVGIAATHTALTSSPVSNAAAGNGLAELVLQIPSLPGLGGVRLWAQVYVADQGLPFPGAVSDAAWYQF